MKGLIRSIFILAVVQAFFACSEKKKECCTTIETNIDIRFVDASGQDLFGSSPQYDEKDVRIYYKTGDEFEYVFEGNLDYPNMHFFYNAGSKRVLRVFPSNHYKDSFSETLIELNENTRDTMKCEFDLGSNYEVCKKVWYNGREMEGRYFEIVK